MIYIHVQKHYIYVYICVCVCVCMNIDTLLYIYIYIYIYMYVYFDWLFGIMVRELTNGLGDWGSILSQSYQKLKKWYLMPPCLTQHYKVRIKGKMEQSEERRSSLLYTLVQ